MTQKQSTDTPKDIFFIIFNFLKPLSMENNNNKFITAGIIVLIILMGAYAYTKYEKLKQSLPYYVTNPTTHKVYQSNKPDKPVGYFSFTNQQGKKITPKEIGKSIYVADYFFVTCPGICKEK